MDFDYDRTDSTTLMYKWQWPILQYRLISQRCHQSIDKNNIVDQSFSAAFAQFKLTLARWTFEK